MKSERPLRVKEELFVDLISKSYGDLAERFDLDQKNCPKHPSNCTGGTGSNRAPKKETQKHFDHLPFMVTFMSYEFA